MEKNKKMEISETSMSNVLVSLGVGKEDKENPYGHKGFVRWNTE